MICVSAGKNQGSQWCFSEMVQWMPHLDLGRISDAPIAERAISGILCQQTHRESDSRPIWHIKRRASSGTREKFQMHSPVHLIHQRQCYLSSSWPNSSIEVVANQVCGESCRYIAHVYRNGQWMTHRNAVQIPALKKSIFIHNYTQSGRDWP